MTPRDRSSTVEPTAHNGRVAGSTPAGPTTSRSRFAHFINWYYSQPPWARFWMFLGFMQVGSTIIQVGMYLKEALE